MIGDTASISLLTGLPGSGKSLRMVQRIVELIEQGTPVYVCNLAGINVPGVIPWDDPTKWNDLPAGSVLFVDEAQQFFRARRGGDPPSYISSMETIRHWGVRLVLATQQPNYLDTHLRGLVGFHEHLLRESGKDQTFIFRNHQVMDEIRLGINRVKKLYDHQKWALPERFFQFYRSAEVHTVKYRMPALLKKALILGPIAIALFVAPFGYLIYKGISKRKEAAEVAHAAQVVPDKSSPHSSPAGEGEGVVARTGEDYVAMLTPQVKDVLWTAGGYIGRKFQSDPHLYCMSTADTCRCVTEQGTQPVAPVAVEVCRDIARYGEPYNPYKAPERERQVAQGERQVEQQSVSQDESKSGALIQAFNLLEQQPQHSIGGGIGGAH